MASKLETICVHMRARATEARTMAAACARVADQAASAAARTAALPTSPSQLALVSSLAGAARRLRQGTIPALQDVARRADQFASELCGGAPSSGSAGPVPRAFPGGPVVTLDPAGEPHGGHGAEDGVTVPPPRTPVEDISRRRITDEVADAAARPEDLPPALVAVRRHWIEQGGHAGLRHDRTQVADAALIDRCTLGHDPVTGSRTDWEHGGQHGYAREATAFTSPEALVFAEARLWSSDTAERARHGADIGTEALYRAEIDAAAIFGPGFRSYLTGFERLGTKNDPGGARPITFPDSTSIFAIYRRATLGGPWFLATIYPRPSQ